MENPFIGECAMVKNRIATPSIGTSNVSRYPIYGYYTHGQFMYMFKSNEFVNRGEKQITGIEVEVKNYIVPYEYPNQTLKLCHSTDNEFNSNTRINLTILNYSTLTTVKNNFTWTITGDGYTSIDFETPFCYNGTDAMTLTQNMVMRNVGSIIQQENPGTNIKTTHTPVIHLQGQLTAVTDQILFSNIKV